jgi:hypothetical protein
MDALKLWRLVQSGVVRRPMNEALSGADQHRLCRSASALSDAAVVIHGRTSGSCPNGHNEFMEISDTLGFLLGTWDLNRSYTDHRSGTTATFQGQAVLATDAVAGPERAQYEETGRMCFGFHQGTARRSLEYDRRPDGSVMLYRPGRQPYVDLDLTSGAWSAVHPCGADRYEVSSVVRSRDVVQEYWRVQGPDKDYTAVTTLRRVGRMG